MKAAKFTNGGLTYEYLEAIPLTEALKRCEIVKKIYDEELAQAKKG